MQVSIILLLLLGPYFALPLLGGGVPALLLASRAGQWELIDKAAISEGITVDPARSTPTFAA